MGSKKEKSDKDRGKTITASETEAKREGMRSRQLDQTKAINEMLERQGKSSNLKILGKEIPTTLGTVATALSSISRNSIINTLKAGGTPVRDSTGQVVGAVSGGNIKTYTGRPQFNPLKKTKTKGTTAPAKSTTTVLSQPSTTTATQDASPVSPYTRTVSRGRGGIGKRFGGAAGTIDTLIR